MISRTALALFLALRCKQELASAVTDADGGQSQAAWHKFGSNVNYRITAILDVNGGAVDSPNFESFTGSSSSSNGDDDGSNKPLKLKDDAQQTKTAGYSVPIEVLTLQDDDGTYRQRISYYSGMQVDYNMNGEGYKVISTPPSFIADKKGGNDDSSSTTSNTCMFTGGDSKDDKKKVGYLNFFPTVSQMDHYTLGNLITDEPGIPYRIATLQAPHGSYNATAKAEQPDASYDAHPGMPTDDWFQFHYEESLSSSSLPGTPTTSNTFARPLKWTMLARNQIINAHTENWVIRYLNYETFDRDEERKLWENWFDLNFHGDCGNDEADQMTLLVDDNEGLHKLNRLEMFFTTSSSNCPSSDDEGSHSSSVSAESSHFDLFLARHNKHYPHPEEYIKRKAIHTTNTNNIEQWNKDHAGKTSFAPNEFLDMEVKEVMRIRGGHIPRGKSKVGHRSKAGTDLEEQSKHSNLRQTTNDSSGSSDDDDDDVDDDDEIAFTEYQVPKDFDPSTLPKTFDWREHLPGSVGPIKDQGFCGSCWAFSFVSALESHWYINHGQSVDLPEQFVNDCAWSDAAHACDGGESAFAAKTIIDKFNGHVPLRNSYGGYLSVDGGCYVDILQNIGVMGGNQEHSGLSSVPLTPQMIQLTDWVVLPERDNIATKHALLNKGPLSIALNVVDEAIYYANGVLDVESCNKHGEENLDHAINLIGWGVDELPDGTQAEHWILRNSWSDLWGDSGYFKVRMGDRDCGVTTSAGYPVVAEPGLTDQLTIVAES